MTAPINARTSAVSDIEMVMRILDHISRHGESMESTISEKEHLTPRRVAAILKESVDYGVLSRRLREESHHAWLYSLTEKGEMLRVLLAAGMAMAPYGRPEGTPFIDPVPEDAELKEAVLTLKRFYRGELSLDRRSPHYLAGLDEPLGHAAALRR